MRVAICGGGVIGAAIAFYLARRGAEPIVVERTGVACAASGKSGGFLALDWCDGTPLQGLARRSFALHDGLARELGGDSGYRRLTTYAGVSGAGTSGRNTAPALPWLSDGVRLAGRLGGSDTTAQIHPARFTESLIRAAQRHGATLEVREVTGLLSAPGQGRVRGVLADGEPIEADAVVIAMGPWSGRAAAWLPVPQVRGLKGHSLVFRTGDQVPAEALFLEDVDDAGETASPEVYPRPDGTTYVCAISSEPPLPDDPAGVEPDPGAPERLEAICRALSPVLERSPVLARQACFRPVTRDGLPLMGRVPGVEGAFVATGHSVWGMLNAPASGEAMAELILDGAASKVDLAPFDPSRLPAVRA